MRTRTVLRMAPVAAMLAAGIWWRLQPPGTPQDTASAPARRSADTSSHAPQDTPNGTAASATPTITALLPSAVERDAAALARLHERLARSSLRGSEVDGELHFDAAGHLIVDRDLRRRFDHFLSLAGEFSLAEIRSLVADSVRTDAGDVAANEALALFDRYLGLLRAIDATRFPADPLARAAAIHALRVQHLGADAAAAMFGADEAALDLALARRDVQGASDIDVMQRAQWLDELDQDRPANERATLDDSQVMTLGETQTAELDARNADAATRHAERAAIWGEDAADRLAQLDAERAEWNARVSHYLEARRGFVTDPAALDAWLRANFSEAERRRLAALEAGGQLPDDPP